MRPDDRCKTSEMLFITIGNNKCHEKYIFSSSKSTIYKLQNNIYKISFDNKTIEKINLSPIFRDPLVKAALPKTSFHFDAPPLVNTLINLIVSKIFSFHKFVNNFNEDIFLDDYFILF